MFNKNLYWKRVILPALLLTITSVADAGVTYDFRQISQSDFQNSSDREVTGTVLVEGDRSRVNLKKGSGHPVGTYIISRSDSPMLFIVDPLNKRFTEVDTSKITNAIGSDRVQISELKTDVSKLPDHPLIAGLPTDHYRVTASYKITVMFGSLPLQQSVVTTIDKWVTLAFRDITDLGTSRNGLKTGNASVDALIDAELTKVKGFPLRQVTTIQTTMKEAGNSVRSKLDLKPTRRQTTEVVITRIENAKLHPSLFEVPATYAKADPTPEVSAQMLTMTP
jgi:hypothetical protein